MQEQGSLQRAIELGKQGVQQAVNAEEENNAGKVRGDLEPSSEGVFRTGQMAKCFNGGPCYPLKEKSLTTKQYTRHACKGLRTK